MAGSSSPEKERIEIRATNTAKEAENKIHDDAVARRVGFSGGLVPGVVSFAYMMQLPLRRSGAEFLSDSYVSARFIKPVYEGEIVAASMAFEDSTGTWDLRLEGAGGDLRAFALVDPKPSIRPEPFVFHTTARPPSDPRERPPLVLGDEVMHSPLPAIVLDSDESANAYFVSSAGLPEDPCPGFVHPARLVGGCVGLIRDNFVRPGPAIHAGFQMWTMRPARAGESLTLFGATVDAFEKHGKRFLVNDAQIESDQGDPIARILNSAIYFGETPGE